MTSGLRIVGHCLWFEVAPVLWLLHSRYNHFLLVVMGSWLHTGGEYWRRLQGVTWGYRSKTHWASFVPVLRQPNICQLFVNFSFETFLANSPHPDTILFPIHRPTFWGCFRLRRHYLSLQLHKWLLRRHSYKQSPLTQFIDLKTRPFLVNFSFMCKKMMYMNRQQTVLCKYYNICCSHWPASVQYLTFYDMGKKDVKRGKWWNMERHHPPPSHQ